MKRTYAVGVVLCCALLLNFSQCGNQNPQPNPTEHLMLAYLEATPNEAEGGKIHLRSSSDGSTWTDTTQPVGSAGGGGSRGVSLAADDSGLANLLAWGVGGYNTRLRYAAAGTWEQTPQDDVFTPVNPQQPPFSAPAAVFRPGGANWLVFKVGQANQLQLINYAQDGHVITPLQRLPVGASGQIGSAGESHGRPATIVAKSKAPGHTNDYRLLMVVPQIADPQGTTDAQFAMAFVGPSGELTWDRMPPGGTSPATIASVKAQFPADDRQRYDVYTNGATPTTQRTNVVDVCATNDNRGSFYMGVLSVKPGAVPGTNQPNNLRIHLYKFDEAQNRLTLFGSPIENLGAGLAHSLQCAAMPGGGSVMAITVGEFGRTAYRVSATGNQSLQPGNDPNSLLPNFFPNAPANRPFSLILAGHP